MVESPVRIPTFTPNRTETPLDQDFLATFGGFPEKLFVISLGEGIHACYHTVTDGPDLMDADGLAVFETEADANQFMEIHPFPEGLTPKIEATTFDEARELAIKKESLECLILWRNGGVAEIHWVN